MARYSYELLIAHNKPCPYCNDMMIIDYRTRKQTHNQKKFPTRDHVISKSKIPAMGVLIVCRECNIDKGNKTLNEWADHLSELNDNRSSIIRKFMKDNWYRQLISKVK